MMSFMKCELSSKPQTFENEHQKDWLNEIKKRGITVYGQIETEAGEKVLKDYVANGHTVYKPKR